MVPFLLALRSVFSFLYNLLVCSVHICFHFLVFGLFGSVSGGAFPMLGSFVVPRL